MGDKYKKDRFVFQLGNLVNNKKNEIKQNLKKFPPYEPQRFLSETL